MEILQQNRSHRNRNAFSASPRIEHFVIMPFQTYMTIHRYRCIYVCIYTHTHIHSNHTGQTNQTLWVKRARVRFRLPSLSTTLLYSVENKIRYLEKYLSCLCLQSGSQWDRMLFGSQHSSKYILSTFSFSCISLEQHECE